MRDPTRQELKAKFSSRNYGGAKGEWCYKHIRPIAFVEEFLESGDEGIPDFKFHCSGGKVRFVHYIYDRASGNPKEIIVTPRGEVTGLQLMIEWERGEEFIVPSQWLEMIRVAENLSKPFKYVRVDFFVAKDKVRFGELTFSPQNGNYRTYGQKVLGGWLEIDRSSKISPYEVDCNSAHRK